MNVSQWINTHQKQAAIGGGAVAVGGFALYRRQKANASASTATTGTISTTPAAGTTGSTGYDSSANDVYNSVEGVLEQLQSTVAGLGSPGALATATPVTTPIQVDGRIDPNHTWGQPSLGVPAGAAAGNPGVDGGVLSLGLGQLGSIPVPAAPTATPVAAPIPMPAASAPAKSSTTGYTHVANPTALKALPTGTPLYTVSNGVYSEIANPTALKALPSGTAIYTKAGR